MKISPLTTMFVSKPPPFSSEQNLFGRPGNEDGIRMTGDTECMGNYVILPMVCRKRYIGVAWQLVSVECQNQLSLGLPEVRCSSV